MGGRGQQIGAVFVFQLLVSHSAAPLWVPPPFRVKPTLHACSDSFLLQLLLKLKLCFSVSPAPLSLLSLPALLCFPSSSSSNIVPSFCVYCCFLNSFPQRCQKLPWLGQHCRQWMCPVPYQAIWNQLEPAGTSWH